jgi:hypothetical protein
MNEEPAEATMRNGHGSPPSSAVWWLDTTSLSLFTPRSEEVPAHEIQVIRPGIGR